MKCVS